MTKYGADENDVPHRVVVPPRAPRQKAASKWAKRAIALVGVGAVAVCGYAVTEFAPAIGDVSFSANDASPSMELYAEEASADAPARPESGQNVKCDPESDEIFRYDGRQLRPYPSKALAIEWGVKLEQVPVADCTNLSKGRYWRGPSAFNKCRSGRVEIEANNGHLLARCDGCGVEAYSNVVTMPRDSIRNDSGIWTVEQLPALKVSLKSADGTYLGASPDENGEGSKTPFEWEVYTIPDGRVFLESPRGKFLSRCKDCLSDSNAAMAVLHATTDKDEWVHWKVHCLPSIYPRPSKEGQTVRCDPEEPDVFRFENGQLRPYISPQVAASWDPEWEAAAVFDCEGIPRGPAMLMQSPFDKCASGVFALRADSLHFLSRCNGCAHSPYPDSATVHANTLNVPWARWTIVKVDTNVIALRADTMNFLARCHGCISGGAYPDSAFVHVSSLPGNPWALWKVHTLPNGKVTLQADNGRYLARCNSCAPGMPPDRAFVHESNPNHLWAQWEVMCV